MQAQRLQALAAVGGDVQRCQPLLTAAHGHAQIQVERLEFLAAGQDPAAAFSAVGEVASQGSPVPLAKGDVLSACAVAQTKAAASTASLGSLRVTWRRPRCAAAGLSCLHGRCTARSSAEPHPAICAPQLSPSLRHG